MSQMALGPRRRREERTVQAMVSLYCTDHHAPDGDLCQECAALAAYARERLSCCLYAEAKPTCARCPIHCYRPEMRQRIRVVMRYAGPRMLLRHPWLAICHLWDGRRRAPRV